MLRRDVLEINGIATPVASVGPPGEDEAVICLHGNPGFSADWTDLLGRIESFARGVAPDMPGFGAAAKPDDFDYSVAGYTRHLTALIDALGVRRAHLVLHDFGVGWGLSWALAHPERVASLTLVNIGVLPGYRWHFMARVWRTPILGELSMAMPTRRGFHLLMKIGNPRGLPSAFVDGMFDHFDAGTRRAVLKLYRATDDLAGDFAKLDFAGLTMPTCVVWGEADPYVPAFYSDAQRQFFPQAEVHKFERSGHFPHADDPERFAGVVVPFLRRARLNSG